MQCPTCKKDTYRTWEVHTASAMATRSFHLTHLSEVEVQLVLLCHDCSEVLVTVPADDLIQRAGVQDALTNMYERTRQ